MSERLTVLTCPHCRIKVVPCRCSSRGGILGGYPYALQVRCAGYQHEYTGHHACNPVNPVTVAHDPVEVAK